MHHFINKCIVDIFVGEIIFHTNNSNDDITKEQSLAIFEDVVRDEEVSPDSDLDKDCYLIILNNPAHFHISVDYIIAVTLFFMDSHILQLKKFQKGLESIESGSKARSQDTFSLSVI